MGSWDVERAPSQSSATHLRAEIRDELCRCGVRRVDDAELLTWELITNAGRHAESGCTVHIDEVGDVAHVSVHDDSSLRPVSRPEDPSREGGHGIELVAGLSSDWGVDADGAGTGKDVWFEVPRSS